LGGGVNFQTPACVKTQTFVKNPAGCVVVGEASRVQPEVGGFLVDQPAALKEGVEGEARVLRPEQGAFLVSGDAFEDDVRVGVEPGDDAECMERAAVFRAKHDAAPGGQDDAADPAEVLKGGRFEIAEVFLAAGGEDVADGAACLFGDQFVGIQKPVAGGRGEAPAHGGFSAAHEADENDIREHAPYSIGVTSRAREPFSSW